MLDRSRSRDRSKAGGAFSPAGLFVTGAQGAWYDPSDFSTLFQNSTGTTPVTAVEQPVRLMLDRSRGLVLGSELVSNPGGPYTATTGWSAGFSVTTSTLTAGSGLLTLTANGTDASPRFVIALTGLTSGRVYRIRLTGLAATGTGDRYGVWTSGSNGTGGSVFNQVVPAGWAGAFEFVDTATATTMYLTVGMAGTPTAGSTLSIASASVRELPGNHATAPNDASRPVLRARYNLLTFSEQFDDAVWGKSAAGAASIPVVTANAGVAPDGTTTADRVVIALNGGTATGDFSSLPQTVTATSGVVYTFTIYLKSNTASSYAMLILGVTGTQFPITVTPTWQRFEVVQTSAAASVSPQIRLRGGQTPTNSDSVDILAWGAQLLTAADAAATGNAYQRIAAATDYDTSNPVWRPYLAFDGSDDSLSTSSIDFTGTDKMTVFAGVTKNTNSAFPVLVELGNRSVFTAGSFTVHPSGDNNSRYYIALVGTSATAFEPETYTPPITNVVAVSFDIAGAARADEIVPRINGVVNQTNPSEGGNAGTGNFGNHPLFIGRRNNTSNPLNGRLYSLAVLGRTATAPELSAMEAWVAGKTGVTLP